MQFKLNQSIQRNPEMISSNMDGETVMMSIENGEYYGLNNIGTRIWELLEKKISLSDLIAQLTREFDVKTNECEKDTTTFLNQLIDKKLIIVSDQE